MTGARKTLTVDSPTETADLAAMIGAILLPGDCLLLDGPIGAGKTHFARHLIQSRLVQPEDVPSPTFTLVQTYDIPAGEIWHADLYRLTSVDEIEELGLTEAFETAICLVEWPDRLGNSAPDSALHITFRIDPENADARQISFAWKDSKWPRKLDFLNHA